MTRAGALVLGAAALLAPALARAAPWLATDAAWRRAAWWSSIPLAVVTALGLDALGYVVFCLVQHRQPGYGRARVHFWAVAATAAVGFATKASGFAMATVFGAGLGYTFVRSMLADRTRGMRIVAIRGGLVLAALGLMIWRSYPSNVATARLIAVAVIAPDEWSPLPASWIDRELQARLDAPGLLEGDLLGERARREGAKVPSTRELALLRLHHISGGDVRFREGWCAGWDFAGYASLARGRSLPSRVEVEAFCRP